jgi:organic hydroperoxide reductase OsmC/OhrA
MKQHRFSCRLEWTGAAAGPVQDYPSYSREWRAEIDGKDPLRGSADPTFRGDGSLHNPEDLLVAALSSCHLLSYLALCARSGIVVLSYADDATGIMESKDGAIRFTDVLLRPRVSVRGDVEKAKRLHEQAHAECFIANSVNFPVRHEPVVTAAT